jgi:SnoaL-like protein
MGDARSVVDEYLKHLKSKELTEQRKLLRDDLSFQGPLDSFSRADDYHQSLRHLVPMVDRIDVKKMFVDGNDVCVIYDMVTSTPVGSAPVVEWHTVEDDKISAIRVYFDARPWAAVMGR